MLFTFLPLFLNKTQTLSSLHIVCVCLVLCSWLFDYKFALICSSVIIMFNLIIILLLLLLLIVIKKKMSNLWVQLDLHELGGLGWTSMIVGLSWIFFFNSRSRLNRKNYSTQSMHTLIFYTCKISKKLRTNYYAIYQMFKFQICDLK